MRKINPRDFTLAKRGTSREINRQIALTLIRTHQPISRADLSRLMETNRANITFLVNELLEENLVREGAQGNEKVRGPQADLSLYQFGEELCRRGRRSRQPDLSDGHGFDRAAARRHPEFPDRA